MKILGIIPARFASSRFPGKPLANIFGKTMIRCVYEQASRATLLSGVVVATDDSIIVETVKAFGGEVLMTSLDHMNGTSRCSEVIRSCPGFDFAVNIQGDEPFIHPEQIDELCQLFSAEEASLFTQAKILTDEAAIHNPNVVKVVLDDNNYAIDFYRDTFAPDTPKKLYKHIGLYGYRTEVLENIARLGSSERERSLHLEQLRWLDNGYQIKVGITELESISVDIPEDIQRLKA